MKKILILLLLFVNTISYSQIQEESSGKFIEVNVIRFAETPGIIKNIDHKEKLDFINGIKIGFKKSEKVEMHLSLMKNTSIFNKRNGDFGELYSSTGYQIGLGLNKVLFIRNRLSFHIGGEILFQYVSYDGDIRTDTGTFAVSGVKTYECGIASLFQLAFKISDQIAISVNTRYGVYNRSSTSNINSISHIYFLFDPINSLGIRVSL